MEERLKTEKMLIKCCKIGVRKKNFIQNRVQNKIETFFDDRFDETHLPGG